VEAIASGVGLDQCARLLAGRYETALVIPGTDERVPVTEIFALSKKGDPLCTQLVANAAEAVANLIMNMVRMCDPDTVVLGGGVVADGYLYSKILERLHDTTMRFVKNGVVITKLNPEFIGLLGAGAVAMDM
jgi:predicted NBD/HSP70 family sugar kinase